MTLKNHEGADLPAMAWCAVIHAGKEGVDLYHGAAVEVFDGGWSDGAWNGPFTAEGLADCTVVCGTAALVQEEGVRFFSSSDRLSPLFSFQDKGTTYVSNSPSFLLAAAGEELDPAYPLYSYDILHIWRRGLFCMAGKMRLASGKKFYIHFSTIVTVGQDGKVETARLPAGDFPHNYAEYHALIQGGVDAIFANARAPERKRPLGSIVAMSRGYDTNANAALVSRAGCRESFTFYDPLLDDPYVDSGADNAAYFGLPCKEVSRRAFLDVETFDEAEFSFVPLSTQAPLAAMEEDFRGKILICGNNGDMAWKPNYADMGNDRTESFARYISGIPQLEYRLRVGYVVFSPACIGVDHSRQLARLSRSEEMKPWDIGGDYNRPLARRLAEDAGVPREKFGQIKLAGGHSHLARKKEFSPRGYERFKKFMTARKARTSLLLEIYWKFRVWWLHSLWKVFGKKMGPPKSLNRWQCKFLMWNNTYPRMLDWEIMFVFTWGVTSLMPRYANPLKELRK